MSSQSKLFVWALTLASFLLGPALLPSQADEAELAKITMYRGSDRQAILVEGAKKEGALMFYSSMLADLAIRPLIAAFEKEYPFIKAQYVREDPPMLVQKLLVEARANRFVADVLESTGVEASTKAAGLVRPFYSPALDDFAPETVDPQHEWAPSRFSYIGPAYNTNLVSAKDVPHTYEDFLDPKWKGRLVWTYDNTGAILIITGIRRFMGEEKALAYLEKLGAQKISAIAASNRTTMDRVVAGEYAITLDAFLHHPILSAAKGAPIAADPIEPVVSVISSMELTKNPPHPYAAMLFVDFLLGVKGQTVLRDAQYFPSNPKVSALPTIDAVVPRKIGLKENFIPPEEVSAEYNKSSELYRRFFGR